MASTETLRSGTNFVDKVNTLRTHEEAQAPATPDDLRAVYNTLQESRGDSVHAFRLGVAASREAVRVSSFATPELVDSLRVVTESGRAIYIPGANHGLMGRLDTSLTLMQAAREEKNPAHYTRAVREMRMTDDYIAGVPATRFPGEMREYAAPAFNAGENLTAVPAALQMANAAVLLGALKPYHADAALAGARIINAAPTAQA